MISDIEGSKGNEDSVFKAPLQRSAVVLKSRPAQRRIEKRR